MSELIVFSFPTETGASEMDETIHYIMKEELINLKDAAVVIRKPDGKKKMNKSSKQLLVQVNNYSHSVYCCSDFLFNKG